MPNHSVAFFYVALLWCIVLQYFVFFVRALNQTYIILCSCIISNLHPMLRYICHTNSIYSTKLYLIMLLYIMDAGARNIQFFVHSGSGMKMTAF